MTEGPISIAQLKDLARDGEGAVPAEVHAQMDKATTRATKAGKPYFDWLVRDAEDSLKLKVWDNHPAYQEVASMKPGAFIAITGSWTVGNYGIESNDWNFRAMNDAETAALMSAGGTFAQQQIKDYAYIEEQVAGLEDPRLRAICALFLERFGERFRRTAAARDYHHARRGGLVEHVAQMMRAGNALAGAYPQVNRGLIIAGILFHDCGKLWENCMPENGFQMPFSEMGELLGHIPTGMELVNRLWRDASEVAGDEWTSGEPAHGHVRLHLLHLIASHHGELAFGSPTVPKTPEAQLLHYIDNIDAKMEMFRRGYAEANMLAPRVFSRVRPLPGNLVEPLSEYDGPSGGVVAQPKAEPEPVSEVAEPEVIAPAEPAPAVVAEEPNLPPPPIVDEDDDVGF